MRHFTRLRGITFAGGGWQGNLTFIFVVWANVGLIVNFFHVELPPFLFWADAFFLTLAAILVLLAVARRDGMSRTFFCFVLLSLATGILEAVGTMTGVPFGQYYYTDKVGWKIAGILPYTIPLAWWSIVAGGHYLLSRFVGGAGLFQRLQIGFLVGVWALAHDVLLEPFAWHVRGYWWWDASSVPIQNYITWFLTAFLLALLLPWKVSTAHDNDPRPMIVASYMLATFACGLAGQFFWNYS